MLRCEEGSNGFALAYGLGRESAAAMALVIAGLRSIAHFQHLLYNFCSSKR